MAIQNRTEFLAKLSSNLGRQRPEHVELPNWSIAPQWTVYENLTQDELVNELVEQCVNIHTEVKITSLSELTATLQSILTEWDSKSIIYSNDERFDEYGLSEYLAGQEKLSIQKWDSDHKQENIDFARTADVGITFSDIALAESGTVVLFNDGLKGRPVSLLPESYIAIIPKSTIVPRLTQAMKTIHELNDRGEQLAPCLNFISGPSNSADIEMNLVVGVHGPIRTTYIIVDDK